MLQGIYTAWKRRTELDSTRQFTNNLQVWLALLSISLLGFLEISRLVWGWWMLTLTRLQWLLLILALIGILFFLAIVIRSIYGLFKLLWHGKFGQRLSYDPKRTPNNVLAAIKPIKDGATIEECRTALAQLITFRREAEDRSKLEFDKRISEYEAIIAELETKSNE